MVRYLGARTGAMLGSMRTETAFRSKARFDQVTFRRWLDGRPAADRNHYELIDGRIVMMPPAGWPHGGLGSNIGRLVGDHVRRLRLGIVLDSSAGYDLPSGDTLEPDVSFISSERFTAGPRPAQGRFIRIVPDLVVEILSPATARRDRTEKKAVYERNGVAEYWIVDPARHRVTVLVLRRARYAGARPISSGPIGSHVFPSLRLPVEQVFDLGV